MRADAPVTFLPALHVYVLTSPLFAYNPINVDKPLHSRLRDPLMAAFTLKCTQSLARTVIADIEDLLDAIALLELFSLVTLMAHPLQADLRLQRTA